MGVSPRGDMCLVADSQSRKLPHPTPHSSPFWSSPLLGIYSPPTLPPSPH